MGSGTKGNEKAEEHIMKRIVLVSVLIFAVCFCAFAQDEKKISVGLGAEGNMNAREMFAGAYVLGFDYNLPTSRVPFAMGITTATSYNFNETIVTELAALLRWYIPGRGHRGLFVQTEAGYNMIFEDGYEGDEKLPLPFVAGLRVGYRLRLGSSFFLEPYARGGYSFFFGAGLIGGFVF
jgi:hypothetical protein